MRRQGLGWAAVAAAFVGLVGWPPAALVRARSGLGPAAAAARPSPKPAATGRVLAATVVAPPPAAQTVLPPEPRAQPAKHAPARDAQDVAEIFYGDRDRNAVALTFDDGPSVENTGRILDVLAAHDAVATFFVLGRRAEAQPALVGRIDAEGHQLGNHAYSHQSFRSLFKSQIRDELDRTATAIETATGRRPRLIRPPFGRYAPSALPLFAQMDLDVVLWSVDGHDWERTREQIVRTTVEAAVPGAIVLLHDRESETVHALPEIIAGLRARGFELVTVSALTGLAPY